MSDGGESPEEVLEWLDFRLLPKDDASDESFALAVVKSIPVVEKYLSPRALLNTTDYPVNHGV